MVHGTHGTWRGALSPASPCTLLCTRYTQVQLLPGTCYIEMARAMVRQQHGEACFALTNVQFQTILFLDEAELRGPPTVRLALDAASGRLTVTSRLESGAWDTHATMTVQPEQPRPREHTPRTRHAHTPHVHVHMHPACTTHAARHATGPAVRGRRARRGAARPRRRARALPRARVG